MRTALVILLICAAIDLILCAILLGFVAIEYRRQKQRAADAGEPLQNARGEFGCLIAFTALGFVALYGAARFLLRE